MQGSARKPPPGRAPAESLAAPSARKSTKKKKGGRGKGNKKKKKKTKEERLQVARRATARIILELGTHFNNAMVCAMAMEASEVGEGYKYQDVIDLYKTEILAYGRLLKKVRHTAQLTRLTVLPVKRSYDDGTAQQSQLNTHLPMLHATLSKPTERSLVRAGLSAAIICLSSARSYQSRLSTPAWGTKVTLRAACLP